MKEVDKKRISNNGKSKRSGKANRRDPQPDKDNAHKVSIAKETESKALQAMPDSGVLVSDLNASTEPSEAYESLVIHYVDDVNRSKKMPQDSKANAMIGKLNKDESLDESLDDHSSDLEKESKQGEEEESDCETVKDSVSFHGDSSVTEDEKVERASRVPKGIAKSDSGPHGSSMGFGHETNKSRSTVLQNIPKEVTKTGNGTSQITTKVSSYNSDAVEIPHKPSSESCEGIDEKPNEEGKDDDALDSIGSDNEKVYEENGEHEKDAAKEKRIEEMEIRIERLEEELREVAALEISLYSVIPEHGSSVHKVHTPARRLSRLYIHAGKYYSQDKRATIAKNTVSGFVLVAKSCGNDVPRLTFWLSNTIVLREIICQSFGSSRHSSPVTRFSLLKPATQKRKGSAGGKQINGFMQFLDDWQETGTLIAALEKVESWIFSRIVESVWWEALTPNMQSPSGDKSSDTNSGKLLWPALGDKQQSSFSIDLWKSAFQDAFQLICPVRAGGHECGCLPVLARMVMEHCVSRLDVAMFNAILRESVHEIPTDPVSDPILDSRVLPIPAGDLSFGSGAQLKNSIGNWSRWLTDMFGMDTDDHLETDQDSIDDDDNNQGGKQKSFHLLSSLSDLLMLPKDMLMDRSIRKEVCPSITLPLVKRILCNFTPDEFSPEAVPGAVLESLNAESIVERRVSGETARSFPYSASPIIYTPPSSAEVATKVAEAGGKSELSRSASVVQRKGYTSDEELDELDCPLTSFIQSTPPSPSIRANGNGNHKEPIGYVSGANERYELLREVWSV